MDWVSLLSASAAALAGTVGVATAFQSFRRAIEEQRQVVALRGASVESAISSDSLQSLGHFFRDQIGSTSIASYVGNDDLKIQFRKKFNAVVVYLTPEGESELIAPPIADVWTAVPSARIDADVAAAYSSIAEGETWNALARIRRALELRLRELLQGTVDVRPRMAAGQMLALATQLGLVDPDSGSSLRYAVQVANRAIHGEDVDAYAAVEAVQLIERFLIAPAG